MKEIIADQDRIQYVGYQGDRRRYRIRFHLADLFEEFPNGTFTLVIRLPGDSGWKQAEFTQMDGTDLIWTVESEELEKAGTIRAQVVSQKDLTIAKDDIYKFKVRRSVTGGHEEPSMLSIYFDENGDLVYSVTGEIDVDFMLDDAGDLHTTAMSGYHLNEIGDLIQE